MFVLIKSVSIPRQSDLWPNFCTIPYRTKFRRTKFSTDKIFRRTKVSTPSRNFDSFVQLLPDFCIEILDKIFDGQNVSSDKIFDTKLKFRHFCPTNFCPIRYFKWIQKKLSEWIFDFCLFSLFIARQNCKNRKNVKFWVFLSYK